MRRILLTFVLAGGLLARTPLSADDLVYTRFGDFLESLRVQAGIPGMMAAVVGRDGVEWERVYGHADLERSIPTRIDTPIHIDGVTEAMTAALVLRCVEQGRVSLEDRVAKFKPTSPYATSTLRQVLTHTAGSTDNLTYSFNPDAVNSAMAAVIRACTDDSYRETVANLIYQFGMGDSVPGADAGHLDPPSAGILTDEAPRYNRALARLAVPYAVDPASKRATVSQYTETTLVPAAGLISTVQDLEKFDLALKKGVLLRPDTMALAWRPPVNAAGHRLPHVMGWFSQNYLGHEIYWQFGAGVNGSSSMIVTWPTRSLTFIVAANSNGLSKGFKLEAGDLQSSPFGKLFLSLFIR
jgi:CubicO group peptidase (beta-lactamase class C family)